MGDDSAESGGEHGRFGSLCANDKEGGACRGVACRGGACRGGACLVVVPVVSVSTGLLNGFARASTSREPPSEVMLEEKEVYFFRSPSPSFPLLMASILSSSSSTLYREE